MKPSECNGVSHESEHDYWLRRKRQLADQIFNIRGQLKTKQRLYCHACRSLDEVIAEESV